MNLLSCSFPTLQACVQKEIKEEVILTNVAKAKQALSPTWICKP